MRRPAAAGTFYAAEPDALRLQVEACFRHDLGPGHLPAPAREGPRTLRALVVPHAGLMFSGPVAAHGYAAMAEDGLPGAVVVVGPAHAGGPALAALSSAAGWASPLGPQPQHVVLREAIAAQGLVAQVDDLLHEDEHSVEVQVPFLRWLAQLVERDVPFVPVLMGLQDETTAIALGDALSAAIRATGLDVLLVASSDLMHAGPDYRIPPPRGTAVDLFTRERDLLALAAVEAMDPLRLLDTVRAREVTMCGAGPVAAVLHAARALGASQAKVLAHTTSHDVRPHASCVGYAAVAVQ